MPSFGSLAYAQFYWQIIIMWGDHCRWRICRSNNSCTVHPLSCILSHYHAQLLNPSTHRTPTHSSGIDQVTLPDDYEVILVSSFNRSLKSDDCTETLFSAINNIINKTSIHFLALLLRIWKVLFSNQCWGSGHLVVYRSFFNPSI